MKLVPLDAPQETPATAEDLIYWRGWEGGLRWGTEATRAVDADRLRNAIRDGAEALAAVAVDRLLHAPLAYLDDDGTGKLAPYLGCSCGWGGSAAPWWSHIK